MEIKELLQVCVERKASDLHISAGEVPMIRVDGDLYRLDYPAMTPDQSMQIANDVMNDEQRMTFEKEWELDFSYTLGDISRFRMNAFKQYRGISIAARAIPFTTPTMEEMDLVEPIFKELCNSRNGIILMTGPTGSGKSTTLAAMINYINSESNKREHILTIEDPIEYIFHSKNCLIQQRETGEHTRGFSNALRSALREDPDIIMVAEMRDLETIRLALTAAETGHLVFSTLHTSSASKSVYRIVDAFPSGEKALIRSMLSESLRAVVAQTLLKKPGGGRRPVTEIMLCNNAIKNLIREDKIAQIYSAMQSGRSEGMRTFEQHFAELVARNEVVIPGKNEMFDVKTGI